MEIESNRTDAEAPPITNDWAANLEAIEDWLKHSYSSSTRTPLAYVVHQDMAVPPEADDPSTNYSSLREQLIARAPIFELDAAGNPVMNSTEQELVDYFKDDNEKVWSLFEHSPPWQQRLLDFH